MKTPPIENPVFNEYANLYDVFYAEKGYHKESSYVLDILNKYLGKSPRSILDIGCGTGGHALIWASKGIKVTGIDRSQTMLEQAMQKALKKKLSIDFIQGDIRKFKLRSKFDAVAAMFAVMGYLTSRGEILSAMECVRDHLKVGGVFLFDVWSGPGVLLSPPGDGVRHIYRNGMEILRTVKSSHDFGKQLVKVSYDILVIRQDRILQRLKEIHQMHYFFPMEVSELASKARFRLVESHPFLRKTKKVKLTDWNVTFILQAV